MQLGCRYSRYNAAGNEGAAVPPARIARPPVVPGSYLLEKWHDLELTSEHRDSRLAPGGGHATDSARRILYLTYNAKSYGDRRAPYFADKRANFPPDVERKRAMEYRFRV